MADINHQPTATRTSTAIAHPPHPPRIATTIDPPTEPHSKGITNSHHENGTSTSAAPSTSSPNSSSFAGEHRISGLKKSCACTKIAIMQLFHEMKQSFATVPDYLVCQYVLEHCHDRPSLVAQLQRTVAQQPAIVQAYPQALRQNRNSLLLPPPSPSPTGGQPDSSVVSEGIATTEAVVADPTKNVASPATNRTAPTMQSRPHRPPPPLPPARADRQLCYDKSRPADCDTSVELSESISNHGDSPKLDLRISDQRNPNNSASTTTTTVPMTVPTTATRTATRTTQVGGSTHSAFKPKVPHRPCTLSLHASSDGTTRPTEMTPMPLPQPTFSAPVLHVPTRPAPPRPGQPPLPLNVSVNLSVTQQQQQPVGGHAPATNVQRHTTELCVTPMAMAASPHPADSSARMRSFTSVQFQLRSPSQTAAAVAGQPDDTSELNTSSRTTQPKAAALAGTDMHPVHISAGSSLLTYASASYDARNGLHSNFQITVDGGGNGTITAMRTQPTYTRPGQSATAAAANSSATTTTPMTTGGSLMSIGNREANTVHRQMLVKQRLGIELDRDRLRLQRMQHEIETLRRPMPPDGCGQLTREIESLQSSCKLMVQQVEEAGPYILGETNEDVYHQVMSSQMLNPAIVTPQTQTRQTPMTNGGASVSIPQTPSAAPASTTLWPAGSNAFVIHRHQHHYQHMQQPSPMMAATPAQPPQPAPPPPPLLPWACNLCTFQNHPLLNKCEQCEMPLIITSGTVPTQTHPLDTHAAAAAASLPLTHSSSSSRIAFPLQSAAAVAAAFDQPNNSYASPLDHQPRHSPQFTPGTPVPQTGRLEANNPLLADADG